MTFEATQGAAAWRSADLQTDQRWIFSIDDKGRRHLEQSVRRAFDPARDLFDYRRSDFDFEPVLPVIRAALEEAKTGRGVALIRGLPREDLTEDEFKVMSWALGLYMGVPRPQGKASQYMSAVRNVGTDYRSSTGRGYSSNAELDFHTDSADVVALSCYNQAVSGGMSMVTSSVAAYAVMRDTFPNLVELLHEPVHFSRQGEQAADEAASYPHPIFDFANGRIFSRWNRNRVTAAQKLEGVPRIRERQQQALLQFDELLRRPDLMYTMFLKPGDVQLLNSHVNLHARTDFVDHEEPEKRRLLFRLWLATPDSVRLPESWRVQYRSVEPGAVRGGIFGHYYDRACIDFDTRQAADLGMKVAHSVPASAAAVQ
ncbi:MAG TPA: TauD/TfdA family dioxygenase [Burkholderiales bacterium]|nr:TauD/TfdA family dioxygenase [Burkholderiales bacterium]